MIRTACFYHFILKKNEILFQTNNLWIQYRNLCGHLKKNKNSRLLEIVSITSDTSLVFFQHQHIFDKSYVVRFGIEK